MNALTPKTNSELFGHSESEAVLMEGLRQGQLAHGWIISGPRGIGKATLAYRFARTLLSGKPPEEISPEDPVFLRVAAGSHADLLIVEPQYDAKKEEFAREINIEQAREIAGFLSLTPGEGRWRVVIIDSVDALNTNSANAILKILEEPPAHAILLLISHNPGRLLPTIRSRCRNLTLQSLQEKDFRKAIMLASPELDSSSITALGELTNYSAGLALQFQELSAITLYNQILDLLSTLPVLDHAKLHTLADKATSGQTHANWQLLTRLVLSLCERSVRHSGGVEVIPISEQERVIFGKMQQMHPPEVWAAKWQEISDQFSLAERVHLDYKQCIIVFFHSLTSREEFRIGSVAA